MSMLAIIGGTGLNQFKGLNITDRKAVETPYGIPSSELIYGTFFNKNVIFLARHGTPHSIPPHKINYRANIWALKNAGVQDIIAIAAVGGISANMQSSDLVIPHQVIDYTYERKHTFFEDNLDSVVHIDFTEPYSEKLRQTLLSSANQAKISVHTQGVYAATQGPRLETAAEINRLEKDGCDIVGMTGMPEAALARELDINYATCAVVANLAAGKSSRKISMLDIQQNLVRGMQNVEKLLATFCASN